MLRSTQQSISESGYDYIIPCFFWADSQHEAEFLTGYPHRAAASEIWIRESLKDLDASLKLRGSRLIMRRRNPGPMGISEAIGRLLTDSGISSTSTVTVHSGISFEPAAREAGEVWERDLIQRFGIKVRMFNTSLLYDPRLLENTDSRGGT